MQLSSIIAHPLEDFKQFLPDRPYCSDSKHIKYIKHRDDAVEMPYIQCNHGVVRYIVFDLDYEGSAWAARNNDVADPTLIVANPDNGHCHAIYQIDPIYPRTASMKSKALFRDVIHEYKDILKADKCITVQKQLVKNPLHPRWNIIVGKTTTLSEMAEYLPHQKRKQQHSNWAPAQKLGDFHEYISVGRNCTMFDYLRHYAYSAVSNCKSQEELNDRVYMLGVERNTTELLKTFKTPLGQQELKDICKSISRWTWEHRYLFTLRNVGVMGFPTLKGRWKEAEQWKKEVKKRRAAAGAYAARQRILNQLSREGITL